MGSDKRKRFTVIKEDPVIEEVEEEQPSDPSHVVWEGEPIGGVQPIGVPFKEDMIGFLKFLLCLPLVFLGGCGFLFLPLAFFNGIAYLLLALIIINLLGRLR